MTAAGYSPRSNGLPLDCGWESPKQLPNICAFSFRLFPKSPPVKTRSGLDVRSLFPGEMGGSLGTGRRAGQGSTAGAPALGGTPAPHGGWRREQHQDGAAGKRAAGAHPGAPRRCGPNPLGGPAGEAGAEQARGRLPRAELSQSSGRCGGQRGLGKREDCPKGHCSVGREARSPAQKRPRRRVCFSPSARLFRPWVSASPRFLFLFLAPHVCPRADSLSNSGAQRS